VVIQNDDFNRSSIHTVVVCELTSVLRRANAPGNVLLAPGEGHLPEQRILGNRIGVLDYERMREVMDGVRLVLEGERANS
jgi:mRNA interferase MazF